MRSTTRYVVCEIGPRPKHPSLKQWKCYLRSAKPRDWTMRISEAAEFCRDDAERVAQRTAERIFGCGNYSPAAMVRVMPRTGGAATDWRPNLPPQPV